MSAVRKRIRLVVVLMVIIGGGVPPIVYWRHIGRAPQVDPEEAKEHLSGPWSAAVVVDVRSPERFRAGHLEGAQSWPYEDIMDLPSAEEIPERFKGRTLLLLCESGILAAVAADRLRELGVSNVWGVRGGMEEWVATAEKPCPLAFCRLRDPSGETRTLPFRESSLFEQWATVVGGFGFKAVYTLLSLGLIIVLWRRRSPDLAALRWGFIFFFIGENFCLANYLIYGERSYLFEYLHAFGMVLCFGFVTFALLEGLDERLLKLSDADARCAAVSLCHGCIKYGDVPCGLKRTFLFLVPAFIVLCLAPLSGRLESVSYNTMILGTFYNSSHSVVYQLFEVRYLPIVAIILFAVSLLVLQLKRQEPILWSKVFFSAGVGALGFSYFRFILLKAYRDNLVWFGFWEEMTELLFVACAGFMLWVFHRSLFREEAVPTGAGNAAATIVG